MAQVKEKQIIEILKKCYDPELPVDLWNLGLIYSIQIQEAYDELSELESEQKALEKKVKDDLKELGIKL